MSLPTFSELMASLNLSNTGEPESGAEPSEPGPSSPSPSSSRSTASSQHPSPSIVVSEPDHSQPRLRSLGRSNRFSPYLGPASNVHIRRGSLPVDMMETTKPSVPERSSSVSPRMHPNTLRDVSINAFQPAPRPRHRKVMHIDVAPDVPISSFVRRHTPQSSPTAPTFHRSGSFSPVLLPTLLSSPMEAAQPPAADEPSHMPDRLRKGLRISSYRGNKVTS